MQEASDAVLECLKAWFFGAVAADRIETVTTHISIVLIGGDTAIKLKRPVRLTYVDFSTPGLRLAACERELELNRRTAPQLYRAVRRVTREPDGGLVLDGAGDLVDAVVEMRRFEADGLLDRRAMEGTLTARLMDRLARNIAAFHAAVPPCDAPDGAARMAAVLDINEAAFQATNLFGAEETAGFNDRFRQELARLSPLLDDRAAAGRVRRCHGDLHLRNICTVDGEPVLFDCLEFDEELGTTDILYDLAFLLMDLWHRGLEEFANLVLNRYLDVTGDDSGLPAMPFFMAVRAAVRAHVAATQLPDAGANAAGLREEARSYFALARNLLEPRPTSLVAVGGLSGSGKSTVAAGLAPRIGPPPGARNLSSDRIRKRLCGVAPETRLGTEAYTAAMSERVYGEMAEGAVRILRLGHGVVADATFERPADRVRIAAAARPANVGFQGLWLDVGSAEMLRRVAARRGDPSDATTEIVQRQLNRDPGTIDWERIDGEGEPSAVAQAARNVVDARVHQKGKQENPPPDDSGLG
ncbi:AAA family ATPase [Aurantimonas sp. A2-1-M11]|uniref:bifunctional aminoglycoside phosphotransferase/ATP-binding protein n=1 Tax=Aurantimonas sp. A2-1-M11 TaxID=3113712 RepID=UPI002F953997